MPTAKQVETAMMAYMQGWAVRNFKDEDSEVTRLVEIGEEEAGVMLTVGDAVFRIVVEPVTS